jgi:hypothetical protein
MQPACTDDILVVVFCAVAALSSIFLALIETSIAWYVAIKLEAWLYGGKFVGCKISDVPTSSASIISQTSEALATPYKGTKLHMARNIIYIHEMVIKVILSDFFVEGMKITPFNGSYSSRGQSHL